MRIPSFANGTQPNWQKLVSKYTDWPIDKVLYIIQNESGGDPTRPGDGGAAYGAFQSHYIQPGASPQAQVEDAHRLYLADKASGGTGFGDWGEGRTYQGAPFGSLGNHPYPDNSDDLVWRGGQPPSPENLPNVPKGYVPSIQPLDNSQGGSISGPDIQNKILYGADMPSPGNFGQATIANVAKIAKSKTYTTSYTPTGKFDEDMTGYTSAYQDALEKLNRYIQSNSNDTYRVTRDASGNSIVERLAKDDTNSPAFSPNDPTKAIWIPDPQGTRIQQEADKWQNLAKNLAALAQAGVVQSGNDAAKAYLTSETNRVAAAQKDYTDNFVGRIKDLTTLQDLPVARAQALATALNTINTANSKNKSPYDPQQHIQNPTYADLTPQISSLQASIPQQAPAPAQIDPNAFLKPPPIPANHPLNGYPSNSQQGAQPTYQPNPMTDPDSVPGGQ